MLSLVVGLQRAEAEFVNCHADSVIPHTLFFPSFLTPFPLYNFLPAATRAFKFLGSKNM